MVIKRQTTDPKAIQDARSLGKELFHEMGPDGEDALFSFLQNKLKGWQTSLSGYKPLADTGNYPGKDEIADGLLLVKKLLACDSSYKFIEQFNTQKADLLDLADKFHDLEQFYEHQKPTWEKLRKAYERFRLNRFELERDAQAGPALQANAARSLRAPSPYGLIKEAEGLITTVGTANTALVDRPPQAGRPEDRRPLRHVDRGHRRSQGGCRAALVVPQAAGGAEGRVQAEESLAHITQAESEALKEFDAANARIEEFVSGRRKSRQAEPSIRCLKKKRVVEPAKLVKTPYLETKADVDGFLDRLRRSLSRPSPTTNASRFAETTEENRRPDRSHDCSHSNIKN